MKKIIPVDAILVPDMASKVFTGKIFEVYQWPQTMFDGSQHTFEMLKRTDTVTAICVADDKIMVIDDEQPHLGNRTSFPGGRVDDTDESIESAIQREILEETGYSFNNWRLVKVSQPYRKIEWFVYVLLAWDVAATQEPKLDPGEKISVSFKSFDEVKQLVTQRTDYLAESQDLFENINSVDELLNLPEYQGQTIE
jgi:ADP-ribose pyrophosphatase